MKKHNNPGSAVPNCKLNSKLNSGTNHDSLYCQRCTISDWPQILPTNNYGSIPTQCLIKRKIQEHNKILNQLIVYLFFKVLRRWYCHYGHQNFHQLQANFFAVFLAYLNQCLCTIKQLLHIKDLFINKSTYLLCFLSKYKVFFK